MIFDDAWTTPSTEPRILIWSYSTPWCACRLQAGSAVLVKGVHCLIRRRFAGPVENLPSLADEIEKRWGERTDLGTLCEPWILALQLMAAEGPGFVAPCSGRWQDAMGWA